MSRVLSSILVCALVWFFAKGIWFATSLSPSIPTDEMVHLQSIELHRVSPYVNPFNETSFNIARPLEKFVRFGQFTENGSLYHANMGTLAGIVFTKSVFHYDSIIVLRLLSLGLALLTVYFAIRLYQELELSDPVIALATVIHVSLMQFSVSSAGASYDSYSNVLSTAALYLFAAWLRRGGWFRVLLLLSCLLLGTVAKLLVAPLLAAIFVGVVFVVWKKNALSERSDESTNRLFSWLALGIFFCSTALFLELFIGNLLEYGAVLTSCEMVYSAKLCREASFYAYGQQVIALYADAPVVSLFEYFPFWMERVIARTIGVYGALGFEYAAGHLRFIQIALVALCAVGLTQWRRFRFELLVFFGVFVFHVLVVVAYNYSGYQKHVPHGINGRYLFPVLSLICMFISLSALSIFRGRRQWFAAAVIGIFVVFQDLPLASQKEPFWNMMKCQDETFYRSLPFQPTPVYDENCQLVTRPS